MNVLVIGKSGQLANELNELNISDIKIHCLGRHDVDLLDVRDIEKAIERTKAEAVINASAYTAVDNAESDMEEAFSLNCKAVENIALCCAKRSIHLVHLSTDFVFDGKQSSPYQLDDECSPINVYGESKRAGEQILQSKYKDSSCIIRTSWVYSTFGNNFVKSMLNLMRTKEQLGIVSDQIGTPTYARDLARVCLSAARNKKTGVFHWTDLGVASWYDFAIAIQELSYARGLLDKLIPVTPITSEEYPTPAKRPSYSVLDKRDNTKQFEDVKPLHWRKQLEQMLDSLSDHKKL